MVTQRQKDTERDQIKKEKQTKTQGDTESTWSFFNCLHPNPFRKEMKKVNKQIKGSFLDEEFYGTRGGN